MATIKDVARQAGVSIATVSRYLNKTAAVNIETAGHISAAIKELGYLPNRPARNLRTTHTSYILVLMPSIENSFLPHVLRGIQNIGALHGYSILIGITQHNRAIEQNYLDLVKSRGVDGIISISPLVSEDSIKELYHEFPIVQCSEYCTPDIPFVTIDNRTAAHDLTNLLIRRGCRRLALISSTLPIVSFQERELGYRQALDENHLPFDPSLLCPAPLSFRAGQKAAEKLLPHRPDGVLAVADILALGAIRSFLDAGRRVPGDIAVAGFDGIPLSREWKPSLTTVVQPGFEMGKTAALLLIQRIDGQQIPLQTLLPHRIAHRESTE